MFIKCLHFDGLLATKCISFITDHIWHDLLLYDLLLLVLVQMKIIKERITTYSWLV